MKQFIVSVPNPYLGGGSRGLNRVAPKGEPTNTTFFAYAEGYDDVRKLFCNHIGVRWSPDGTEITYIAEEPRITRQSIIDASTILMDEIKPLIEDSLPNKARAVEMLQGQGLFAYIREDERGKLRVTIDFNGFSMNVSDEDIISLSNVYKLTL